MADAIMKHLAFLGAPTPRKKGKRKLLPNCGVCGMLREKHPTSGCDEYRRSYKTIYE